MNVRRAVFVLYVAKRTAQNYSRLFLLQRIFCNPLFATFCNVDSYGECENVVNPGEESRVRVRSSVVSSRRKIGKIRRIVGEGGRTCATRLPFAAARQKIRKIRPKGRRRRVEFSPSRYIGDAREFKRVSSGKSVEFTRHQRRILVALFCSTGDVISRVYRRTISCGKIHREPLFEATNTRAHTHTLDSIFTFTSAPAAR